MFLTSWYQGLFAVSDEEALNAAYWDRLIAVREAVSKELEKLRVAGGIGSGLDARSTFTARVNWRLIWAGSAMNCASSDYLLRPDSASGR